MRLVLPDLPYPPSVNSMWRTPSSGKLAGRTMLSQEGREYRQEVYAGLLVFVRKCNLKRLEQRLAVDIEVFMPDRRKRDLDNLPKAILDAITYSCIWGDDGQIDDLRVRRAGSIVKGGSIRVTITDAEPVCVDEALALVAGKWNRDD